MYDFVRVRPNYSNFQYRNTYDNEGIRAIVEIEGAISSTNVNNYRYLGEYQGHHYFESTFNDSWTDHANRINDNEFSAYGDKAYLYIPNSNEEHVVWLAPKLQNQGSWYFIGIHKNYRYILPDYKQAWTDVKGNLLPSAGGGTEYVTTIAAGGSIHLLLITPLQLRM